MILKFEIYRGEQSWCARCLGESIYTQARSLDKLMKNIHEAASLHFEGRLPKGEKLTILTISESTLSRAKATTD